MNFSNLLNLSEQSQIQAIDTNDFNTAYDLDGGRLYTKENDSNHYLYYRTKKHVEYNLSTGGLSTGATIDKHGWLSTSDYYTGGMGQNISVPSGNTWTAYDTISTPQDSTLPPPYDPSSLNIVNGQFTLNNVTLGDTLEVVTDLLITPSSSNTSVNTDVRLYVQGASGQYFEIGERLIDGSDGQPHLKQSRLLLPISTFLLAGGITPNFVLQFRSNIAALVNVRGFNVIVWR